MISVFILILFTQPITDLGVMSPNRAIILEKCTNRNDFVNFTVELQAMRWPSNYVKFQTTNTVLRMDDFMSMPPGPCVMSIKSTCADGEESPLSLFKLDIRRDAPKAPRARVIATSAPPFRNNLTNAMRAVREKPVVLPSGPFIELGSGETNVPAAKPLPEGKPETYSDGVIKMQRFYAEQRGRRSQ